jgi:hypothetical protein
MADSTEGESAAAKPLDCLLEHINVFVAKYCSAIVRDSYELVVMPRFERFAVRVVQRLIDIRSRG